MVAKIIPMPPPVVLDDEDLELMEQSCRRVAALYRRKGDLEAAATLQRIADNIARARTPRCSGGG